MAGLDMERRDFLKGLGVLIAAAYIPKPAIEVIGRLSEELVTNQFVIYQSEWVRSPAHFASMFRMLGQFAGRPPKGWEDKPRFYGAFMVDDLALMESKNRKQLIEHMFKNIEADFKRKLPPGTELAFHKDFIDNLKNGGPA